MNHTQNILSQELSKIRFETCGDFNVTIHNSFFIRGQMLKITSPPNKKKVVLKVTVENLKNVEPHFNFRILLTAILIN